MSFENLQACRADLQPLFFILTFAALPAGAETIRVALDPGEVMISVDPDGMTAFKGIGLQRLNPVGAPNLP